MTSNFSAQFMNWADLYVGAEVRLLAYSYFCPEHALGRKNNQFVKWATVVCSVHKMGNVTDGVSLN
jgi:hypothetical protein